MFFNRFPLKIGFKSLVLVKNAKSGRSFGGGKTLGSISRIYTLTKFVIYSSYKIISNRPTLAL